jgi:hypothetical protein
MARVCIIYPETIRRRLPPVCMRCGAPTDRYLNRTFSWYPSWVWIFVVLGLLAPLLIAMCIAKRMKVDSPMCDAHRNHWRWRSRFVWFGLLAILIAGLAAFIVYIDLAPQNPPNAVTIWSILRYTWITIAIAWLIGAAVFTLTAVRPFSITDDEITLGNLAPDFVKALEVDRQRYEVERRERKQERQEPDGPEKEREGAIGAPLQASPPNGHSG